MQDFRKTRLAPTPSGYLHPGNVASFLLTQSLAQKHGAKILLRIDDNDAQRYRPAYAQHIFDTLAQCGIGFHEGPQTVHELEAHWSQRHRLALYAAALQKLIDRKKIFACTCSRTTVICTCAQKNLSLDTPGAAWRLHTTETPVAVRNLGGNTITALLPASQKNFVVRRRDNLPAYHLCSVTDDLHFGVDLIVRGEDLWPSTLAQLQLAEALGEKSFAQICFVHHQVLLDAQGKKLSKSAGNFLAGPHEAFDVPALKSIAQEWQLIFQA